MQNARISQKSLETSEEVLWPVYELIETTLLKKQLVMTPHMLLDRLRYCYDLAAEVESQGNAASATELKQEIDRMLQLLWRGGLWTEGAIEERVAHNGRTYEVLREPFTDGKPHGKPLPEEASPWLCDILGITPTASH